MSPVYDIVLADPPWSYNDKAHAGRRGADYKYPTMPLDDIKALPVADLTPTDKGSVLYLWATAPFLPVAIEVMEEWGFSYKTVAFVWVKTTKHGKFAWGMGHYTRANAEFVLLGVRRPKVPGLPVVDHGVHSVVQALQRAHSQKPDDVMERIERLHGADVRRIELFARRRRPGWSAWGNQVPGGSDVELVDGVWRQPKQKEPDPETEIRVPIEGTVDLDIKVPEETSILDLF